MSSPKCRAAIRRCRRSWSAAISTAGTRAPARSTTAPAWRSPPPRPSGSWTPAGRCAPSASSGSAPRRSACSAARDYRARHGKEPHYALIESDFGADRIWKVDSKLGEARKAEAEAIGKALAPLGIVTGSFDEADGSDIGPMLADGHPGVGLSQDGTRYFDLHHTPDDTLDKIDPAQLRQNVAAWTAVLAILSGGSRSRKRRKRR